MSPRVVIKPFTVFGACFFLNSNTCAPTNYRRYRKKCDFCASFLANSWKNPPSNILNLVFLAEESGESYLQPCLLFI